MAGVSLPHRGAPPARVLLLNPAREPPGTPMGGIQKALLGQVLALRSGGRALTVLSAAAPLAEAAARRGCQVLCDARWHDVLAPLRSPALGRALLALRRQRPAVVVHHSGRTWPWARTFFRGLPNVVVLHRELPRRYRHFDRWLALSPGYAEALQRQSGEQRRIAWAPNCLTAALPPERTTARGDRPYTLGFMGRASEGKGLTVLLEALAACRRRGHRVALKLAGTVDDWAHEALGHPDLSGAVEALGWFDEPAQFLEQVDCLVLPSEREAFGLVIIEAMAAGLPVIATRCNGPASIVENARTGLLVPIGDSAALSAAISRLALEPERAAAMGRAGRARVQAHYTPEAVAPQLLAALGRLGAHWPRPRGIGGRGRIQESA